MMATAAMDRPAARSRDAARRRSRWSAVRFWIRHRLLVAEAFVLPALLALTAVLGVLAHLHNPWIQTSMVTLPLLLGGFTLTFTAQLVLLFAAAIVVLADSATMNPSRPDPGTVLLVGLTALVVLVMSRERVRLGVRGTRGESMLFDLRERLQAQGRVPRLPNGWDVDVALQSAGGHSFAGDFLIAARSDQGRVLQLGLVDVSGKGLEAGTRALALSGAFGGLLGSVPAREFLAAANRYLLRQGWEEGFATAVHLVLDLESGDFECYSAGHRRVGARRDAGPGARRAARRGVRVLPRPPGPRRRAAALHRRTRRAAWPGPLRGPGPAARRRADAARQELPGRRHADRGHGRPFGERRPCPRPAVPCSALSSCATAFPRAPS